MSAAGRRATAAVFAAMLLAVLAVYCPPELLRGGGETSLFGMDFWVLHLRRMQFVRESFAAGGWSLPGWYPRELLGTPFWANLQSFPWIPTRLALHLFEPGPAYAVGVNLAALLAASFTWLFARSLGWRPAAAAAAGFSFACAGYFAARVTVGHLPLLEAYPALPLLLWLAQRSLRRGHDAGSLLALAAATACVVVAGHPQLPAYAVASALAYLFFVGRGRRPFRAAVAMGLGAGATLAVWWPMLRLLARSTRTLPLEPARNDLALPLARLGALLRPWKDGWPSAVDREPHVPFSDAFSTTAYFWDTVGYVGLLPWLAALALLGTWLWRGRPPARRGVFFAVLGAGSLLLALPLAQDLARWVPGTYLRSPARLLYLTGFTLCLALGAGVQQLLGAGWPRPAWGRGLLVASLLAVHAFDVVAHARPFVRTRPARLREAPRIRELVGEHLDTGRVAIDWNAAIESNRRFDDVGFFDSVVLAAPYRALLALAGGPPETNVQSLRGSALPRSALSNLGVYFVVSRRVRRDLPRVLTEGYHLYAVPSPTPRAAFFPPERVEFRPESEMLARLGDEGLDLGRSLALPPAARGALALPPAAGGSGAEAAIGLERPAPDRLVLRVDAPQAGFIRVLESWDPGWTARLDGERTPLWRADGFALGVAVGSGKHRVELAYHTPGARAGALASLASVAGLGGLLLRRRRARSSSSTSASRERKGPNLRGRRSQEPPG